MRGYDPGSEMEDVFGRIRTLMSWPLQGSTLLALGAGSTARHVSSHSAACLVAVRRPIGGLWDCPCSCWIHATEV